MFVCAANKIQKNILFIIVEKKSLLQIVWKLPQQPSWSRELRLLQTEIIRLKNYFSSKILPSNNQVYEQRRNHETVLVGHVEET